MNTSTADLVPVTDRLAPVRWVRGAMAALIMLAAASGATPLTRQLPLLGAVTALYVVGLAAVEEVWRRTATSGLRPIGILLLLDGLYLAWAGAATGGASGIVAFLVLMHVAAVTLLVSYRTGVKVALWHSLLLYGAHELHALGRITTAGLGAEPYRWLLAYTAVLWLVAVATASLSAVNERELRRRRADLEALADFAAALNQVDDPVSVAEVLAGRVRATFGFARVVILSGDEQPVVLAAAGLPPTGAAVPTPGRDSVLLRAAAERHTQLAGRLAADDAGLQALLPGAGNLLVVPLVSDRTVLGALVAEHGGRPGRRVERRLVTAVERFADHGALALRAARLLEATRRQATVDGLTGAANRRAFDGALSAEVSRAVRAAQAQRPADPRPDGVALLLLDVDNFKIVNDSHGHQVGDDVLCRVAATLMTAARDFDTVARYGGEEFAVILPGCDASAALAAAERLRREVEQAEVPVSVTVSVGVSVAPEHGDTPASLVKAADDALLAAKTAGRNRVCLSRRAPRFHAVSA